MFTRRKTTKRGLPPTAIDGFGNIFDQRRRMLARKLPDRHVQFGMASSGQASGAPTILALREHRLE
jgi:hypothetical protein